MDELKFGDPRLPERFWNRHTVDSQGCWVWNSSKCVLKNGRAYFHFKGKLRQNYAVTCDVAKGPLPLGLDRSHICPGGANKLCANPAHLIYESRADNFIRERAYSFEYPVHALDKKEYRTTYYRLWSAENREADRARKRRFYQKHKDRLNAQDRAQRAAKREAKNKAKK